MDTVEDSQEPTGGVGLYFSGKSSNIAMVIGYQGCHSRGLQSLHWEPTAPTVIAFAQGPELSSYCPRMRYGHLWKPIGDFIKIKM